MTDLVRLGILKQNAKKLSFSSIQKRFFRPLTPLPVQLQRSSFLSQKVRFILKVNPTQTSCDRSQEVHRPEYFPMFRHNTNTPDSYYIQLSTGALLGGSVSPVVAADAASLATVAAAELLTPVRMDRPMKRSTHFRRPEPRSLGW